MLLGISRFQFFLIDVHANCERIIIVIVIVFAGFWRAHMNRCASDKDEARGCGRSAHQVEKRTLWEGRRRARRSLRPCRTERTHGTLRTRNALRALGSSSSGCTGVTLRSLRSSSSGSTVELEIQSSSPVGDIMKSFVSGMKALSPPSSTETTTRRSPSFLRSQKTWISS